MRIVSESSLYLTEPLNPVGVAVNPKPVVPEFSCVLLYTEGSKLWYFATNGHMSYRKPVVAELDIQQAGSALVNFSLLQASLQSVMGKVSLHTTDRNLVIQSLNDKRIFRRLPLANKDNLPNIPKPSGESFVIPASTLRAAADQVAFAAIKEGSRPELYGMHIGNQAICGDGTRVAAYNLGISGTVTIPMEPVMALSTILPSSGDVEVSLGSWVRFVMEDGSELQFIKMQVDFPDAAKLLLDTFSKKSYRSKIVVEAKQLHRVFSAAAAYTEKAANLGISFVKAVGDGEDVTVSISVPDLGTFEDVLDCEYEGDVFEILLAPSAIIDIANRAKEKVELKIFSTLEPILARDVNDENWSVVQSVMATKAMHQEEEEDF